jgi:hypothetical protein
MKPSRSVTLAVVLFVALSGIGITTIGASATSPHVQISSVTVVPEEPAPGESTRIEVALRNLQSSNETVEVTDVYVRKAGTAQERERVENVGSIAPGGSITVPMSLTFQDAGYKQLTVHAVVKDEQGNQYTYEYPLYIPVEKPDETLLSFSTDSVVAGETEPVNVTVANGNDDSITGIQFDLNASGAVANAERVVGSLASGAERTFQYDVTFTEANTGTLVGTVTYTTAEGVTRTATESTRVDVVEPTVRADLSAGSLGRNETTRVELANLGNTDFTNVAISATTGQEVLTRNAIRDIPHGTSRATTFDFGSTANGTVTYTATYTAASTNHTETIQASSEIAGRIQLSGVESAGPGSMVTLDGDAANIGSTDAESVVVTIPDTESVSPAGSAEYFVGTVEASEFATFELSAEVGPNASSVPIELSYIADGERVTATQRVEVSTTPARNVSMMGSREAAGPGGPSAGAGGGSPSGAPGAGGSGFPLGTIGIALVVFVLAGVGFAAYRWRQGA